MQCPYCAEEIRDEAIKCRFCGEFLEGERQKARRIDWPAPPASGPSPHSRPMPGDDGISGPPSSDSVFAKVLGGLILAGGLIAAFISTLQTSGPADPQFRKGLSDSAGATVEPTSATGWLVGAIVVAAASAALSHAVADRQQKSLGLALGLFLGPLGVLVAAVACRR